MRAGVIANNIYVQSFQKFFFVLTPFPYEALCNAESMARASAGSVSTTYSPEVINSVIISPCFASSRRVSEYQTASDGEMVVGSRRKTQIST